MCKSNLGGDSNRFAMTRILIVLLPVFLSCQAEQRKYYSYDNLRYRAVNGGTNPVPVHYTDQPLPGELKHPAMNYTEEEKTVFLNKALREAWEQYGIRNADNIRSQTKVMNITLPDNHLYHRDTTGAVPTVGSTLTFQPWQSEWDTNVKPGVPAPIEDMEPSWITRIILGYMDFEVNHHELADFLREALFFVLAGIAVFAWLSLGAMLGFLPVTVLNVLGVSRKRDIHSRRDEGGNDLMSDITDRIYLALDGDWLKKLEEKVLGNDRSNWLTTNVKCCILPDAKTSGMAECQLVKREKRQDAYQCLTDLYYNIQFGPALKKNSTVASTKLKN